MRSVNHEPTETEKTEVTTAGTISSQRKPSLNGLRVLVVDDEPDSRELIAAVLLGCGAKVVAVDSAEAALEEMEQQKFDVLVSDIGMPLTDGFALIEKIRQLPPEHGGRIPAAALTAYAGAEDRKQALASGYQRHVAKPVEPAELTTIVASLAEWYAE